jgi:YggT family protein
VDIILVPLIKVFLLTLGLFKGVLIVYAIMGWLIGFNILNRGSVFVYRLYEFLFRVVNPIQSFFLYFFNKIGIIDLSFFVLFLSVIFTEQALYQILVKF